MIWQLLNKAQFSGNRRGALDRGASTALLRRSGMVALYLLAIVTAVAFGLPFFWTVSSSLKPITEIYLFPPTLWPQQIRWLNYRDVFVIAPFARLYYEYRHCDRVGHVRPDAVGLSGGSLVFRVSVFPVANRCSSSS